MPTPLDPEAFRSLTHWDCEFASDFGFRVSDYALYRRGKLYYVGPRLKPADRLGHHLKDRHSQSWDRFSVAGSEQLISTSWLRIWAAESSTGASSTENKQFRPSSDPATLRIEVFTHTCVFCFLSILHLTGRVFIYVGMPNICLRKEAELLLHFGGFLVICSRPVGQVHVNQVRS